MLFIDKSGEMINSKKEIERKTFIVEMLIFKMIKSKMIIPIIIIYHSINFFFT
jgi:hypothetical protein